MKMFISYQATRYNLSTTNTDRILYSQSGSYLLDKAPVPCKPQPLDPSCHKQWVKPPQVMHTLLRVITLLAKHHMLLKMNWSYAYSMSN